MPEPPLGDLSDPRAWNPLQPPPEPTLDPERLSSLVRNFEQARMAIQLGQYGRAVHKLEGCVRAHPRSADCHLLMGYARGKINDRTAALRHYKQFLLLAPRHPSAAEISRIVAEAEGSGR
jgi:outer membrane protein assembly factor BamD (BamD/ComL family)